MKRMAAILFVAFIVGSVEAQTLHTLHAFDGADGEFPLASPIRDSAGNLYGTTSSGGSLGLGVVFKIDKNDTFTVLHSFTGSPDDGQNPQAALLRDASGNLYGTAALGGTGVGAVYKIDASGTETMLYNFGGGDDGGLPLGSLVPDKSGNLYGTTSKRGTYDAGTIFKLSPKGKLTTLYTFTGGKDGSSPTGNLVRDAAGNLYGTTSSGGTLYRLDKSGAFTVLVSLPSPSYGGLISDGAGNLYGTTIGGGTFGYGTVFRVNETTHAFELLYSFNGFPEGEDSYSAPARDSAGNLYGTNLYTTEGKQFGTVWKLDATDVLTVLTNFGKGNQGKSPRASVVVDKAGNVYATTSLGGGGCRDCGTVFKITP